MPLAFFFSNNPILSTSYARLKSYFEANESRDLLPSKLGQSLYYVPRLRDRQSWAKTYIHPCRLKVGRCWYAQLVMMDHEFTRRSTSFEGVQNGECFSA